MRRIPVQDPSQVIDVTDQRDGLAGARGRLLLLMNPGQMSRPWLLGMGVAVEKMGIPTDAFELRRVWEDRNLGRIPDPISFRDTLRRMNVKAVLSYTSNGSWEWPALRDPQDHGARAIPYFEQIGVPHLVWWSDHPQWANNKDALLAKNQFFGLSPNTHHFMKSDLAAREIQSMLHWPNCHGLPVAEDVERIKPVYGVTPDFDVVTIIGCPPTPDAEIDAFLEHDDPDVRAIRRILATRIHRKLADLWDKHVPTEIRATVDRFAHTWVDRRRQEPLTGSFRIFERLEPDHPEATGWLRSEPQVYFDAVEALWEFGRWQRTFVTRYLAKYFSVGVFGSDWSSVGLPAHGVGSPDGDWVLNDDQPQFYARGRVALSVSQAGDEEGIAHKPFQMAASGAAMVHIDRQGLSDCFTPGVEVETFQTPREARDKIAALLADPARREAMGHAARERVVRDHSWEVRMPQMLTAAGLDFASSH